MSEANPAAIASMVVWGAFVLAFVFGAVASKTNFCTMGAALTMKIQYRRLMRDG